MLSNLASHILPNAGLQHAAEHHLVNLARAYTRLRNGRLRGHHPQVGRSLALERTAKRTYRGSLSRQNYHLFFHIGTIYN